MDSKLQIFEGRFHGRKLVLPAGARPTQARARLAVFNMLPVSGLDGGRLLLLLIGRHKDLYFAERIVRLITVVFSVLALVLGVTLLFFGRANISVFIVTLYFAVWVIIKR